MVTSDRNEIHEATSDYLDCGEIAPEWDHTPEADTGWHVNEVQHTEES
jgi:hypothetical protein